MLPAPALVTTRRIAFACVTLVVASIFVPGAAQASTYRYWNFWTMSDGSWVYSQLGPASTFPEDGDVQGWIFAATDEDSKSVPPSTIATFTFADACRDTPTVAQMKRVALVIDSGSIEIAPEGQTPPELSILCATGDIAASGYELLNSVTELRTQNGLICAMNAYPAMECAAAFNPREVTVTAANQQSEPTPQQTTSAVAPLGTALVVGMIAVAGFYFWRKRSP